MKALAVTQPHASLIVKGRQIWLTRQYEVTFRGPVAIVAAKNIEKAERELCLLKPIADYLPEHSLLPKQKVLGVVDLVECKPALMVFEMTIQPHYEVLQLQADLGRWEHGWWACEFRNPRELMIPIECAGQNHLWNLATDVESEVISQLDSTKRPPVCPTCRGMGFCNPPDASTIQTG